MPVCIYIYMSIHLNISERITPNHRDIKLREGFTFYHINFLSFYILPQAYINLIIRKQYN